ncbi:MAG: hypothetical protein DI587_07030 [Variovorax paradoxus]|nr:MAG: hypothetical protein DI583_07030 [Variovorax paradoxus]PZQ13284.1 MAG: hypothetical protein DI587_07030 [Variovorax paradoxus]
MCHRIRTATADEADPACAVLHASITHCCVDDHHGDPVALDAWLRNKTPAQLRAWILSPHHHAITAFAGGRPGRWHGAHSPGSPTP